MINQNVNYTIQDFRIKSRSYKNYNMSTHHFHDSYEIYYMNSGTRDYFINDKTFRVQQGNLVLIRPNVLHKTMDTGEQHSRLLLSFRPTFLPFKNIQEIIDGSFRQSGVIIFNFAMQDRVEQILGLMVYEATAKPLGYEARLQSHLITLLVEVARYLETEPEDSELEPTVNQKIFEVIQYLKSNYKNNITLEQLAEDFYISRYYLSRVFKKATGFTIFKYIHSLRILEAQRLLKDTDMKVIEIAEAVGFVNVSNFGKVFKSISEVSPAQYRKHQRESLGSPKKKK